jgi:hypothetical protein
MDEVANDLAFGCSFPSLELVVGKRDAVFPESASKSTKHLAMVFDDGSSKIENHELDISHSPKNSTSGNLACD